jgi:hypothetical protein
MSRHANRAMTTRLAFLIGRSLKHKNTWFVLVKPDYRSSAEVMQDRQISDAVGSFDFTYHLSSRPIDTVDINSTKSTIVNQATMFDVHKDMKRTVQVNVKMTDEDFSTLRGAAEQKWPDAVMTNSGIVLALARIAAREILGQRKKR